MSITEIEQIVKKRIWKYQYLISAEFLDFINLFPNTILLSNEVGEIIQANVLALESFGYTYEELLSLTIEDLVPKRYRAQHPKKRGAFFKDMQPRVIGNRTVELLARKKSGIEFPIDASLIGLKTNNGNIALSIISDITYKVAIQKELEKANEALKEMAFLDELTHIPNRRHFEQYLSARFSEAKRHNTDLALLYMDIDHFKKINDTYGHAVGDMFLKEMSHRFQSVLRQEDFVARIGGDEFCIVLPYTSKSVSKKVVNKLFKALESVIYINQYKLNASVSVGVCNLCAQICSPEKMLQSVDKGMYLSKKITGNAATYCVDTICNKNS